MNQEYRENPQLLIGLQVGTWTIQAITGQKVTLNRKDEAQTMSLGRLLSGGYLENIPAEGAPMTSLEILSKRLDEAIACLLMGLQTDGGHHKQYEMEKALELICGEAWVVDAKKEFEWEPGIPS